MADVGRQRQHGLIDLHTLGLPLHYPVHDEGVPQVMNARGLVRPAVIVGYNVQTAAEKANSAYCTPWPNFLPLTSTP
jgi:hypothetical protein